MSDLIDLFVDFETRSAVEIKENGLDRYVSDPTTLPLMLAYGNRSIGRNIWRLDIGSYEWGLVPKIPTDLRDFAENPRVRFHAHNAGFEIAVWNAICSGVWGWPSIPLDRWYCTAAKGSAANQPRNLDKLAKSLELGPKFQKDFSGKNLIKLLSIPQKCQKTYTKSKLGKDGKPVKDANGKIVKEVNIKSVRYLNENGIETFPLTKKGKTYDYHFCTDADLLDQFAAYNLQDIVAEEAADGKLPDAGPYERSVWLLDQKINARGIPVDLDLCRGALEIYHEEVNRAHAEMESITEGEVTKCSQRERLVNWVNRYVVFGSSLADDNVSDFLGMVEENPSVWASRLNRGLDLDPNDIMPKVIRALQLRQLAGGTAVGKYKAALDHSSSDGRVRHQLLYYGASTGRWTGKGIQPHNFKRSATPAEHIVEALKSGDYATATRVCEAEGTTVFKTLKACLRGIICAKDGKKLVVSDFAGIESRVLSWLCGNHNKLELFNRNEDTYIHAAVPIFGVTFDGITEYDEKEGKRKIKKEFGHMRQIGKACELGLGYGMGADTFQSNALKAGNDLSIEFSQEVVSKWRGSNPQIPEFWKKIEKACKSVILNRHKTPRQMVVLRGCHGLAVYYDPRNYLCIRLPSGRVLYYSDPIIDYNTKQIFYRDGSKVGSNLDKGRIDTYGGKLTENIVQAIARDLLVFSMKMIDAMGYQLIMHVHDETVSEVDDYDTAAKRDIHNAMETLPDWAVGLPLKAETHETKRYTK